MAVTDRLSEDKSCSRTAVTISPTVGSSTEPSVMAVICSPEPSCNVILPGTIESAGRNPVTIPVK